MLDKILELTIDGQKQALFINRDAIFKEIANVIDRNQKLQARVSTQINCFYDDDDIRNALLSHDEGMTYDRWRTDVDDEAQSEENFMEFLEGYQIQGYDIDPEDYLLWIIECKVDLPF